jgi:hypothetical protein
MCLREMGVPLNHTQRLMTKYFCDLLKTGTTHCQAACCTVSQVMEAEIDDASTFDGVFPCRANIERSRSRAIRKHQLGIESVDFGMFNENVQSITAYGPARVSPFFVSRRVSMPRLRSTLDQHNDNSSPLLAPVVSAKTPTVCRHGLPLIWQESRSRCLSSSLKSVFFLVVL